MAEEGADEADEIAAEALKELCLLLGIPEADCDTEGADLDSLIEIPPEEGEDEWGAGDDWKADDDWKAEFNQKKMQILEEVAAYTIEITDLDGSTTMTEDEVAEPIA